MELRLRMKNFNNMGVHCKMRFLVGVKKQYIGGYCLKRGGGLDRLQIYGGSLGNKRGGVFEGGLIPQCTLCTAECIFNKIEKFEDLRSITSLGRTVSATVVNNTNTIISKRKSLASRFQEKNENCFIDGCPCHLAHC